MILNSVFAIRYLALSIGGTNAPQFQVTNPSGIGTVSLDSLISTGITLLFTFSILLTLFFLIYGGISFIISGGDKQKVVNARQKLTFAIVGLIVVLLAYFIVNVIYNLFGLEFVRVPIVAPFFLPGTGPF